MIYVGPVTREQLRDAGVQGDSTGYFLCEFDASDPVAGASVLGSFVSPEAAYRFAELLGLFGTDRPLYALEEPLEFLST